RARWRSPGPPRPPGPPSASRAAGILMDGRTPTPMLLDPRRASRSPRSGLTSRATLLALAGGGAALFVFVIFPRLTTSEAAEGRRHFQLSTDAAAPAADEQSPLVEGAALPADETKETAAPADDE